jgi:5-methylcytosine-specific restriction protein A
MNLLRQPPRKPNLQIGQGLCVWCGGKLEGRRRSWCSDECVTEYRVANFAGDAVRAVRARDHGVCAGCGLDTKTVIKWRQSGEYHFYGQPPDGPVTPVEWHFTEWHADHIVPLWSVDRSAPDAFRYWTLDNLQTLCAPCHKAKSKSEAAARARGRAANAAVRTPDLFAEAV